MVSKEQLMEDLQDFADEIGKTPTKREMDNRGPWSAWTYQNHFGSWNEALKKAGLDTNKEINISAERLVSDLRVFADEIGKIPTCKEMNNRGPWGACAYRNHFGSWNEALKKAGLDTNKEINISAERLVSDLRVFADEIGKIPTKREMNEKGPWSHRPYRNHFGSWNEALKKAGLDTNKEINISKEKAIADLQYFANELGKTPTKKELKQKGPWSEKAYRNHFGSWNEALKEAGLEINRKSNTERAGTGEYSYGENWHSQREKVVKRDDHTCRVCGDDNFVHVHHIKPRSEFDDVSNSNTLDNLVTLCPSCHGTFEGRWQNSTADEFVEKAKELIQ